MISTSALAAAGPVSKSLDSRSGRACSHRVKSVATNAEAEVVSSFGNVPIAAVRRFSTTQRTILLRFRGACLKVMKLSSKERAMKAPIGNLEMLSCVSGVVVNMAIGGEKRAAYTGSKQLDLTRCVGQFLEFVSDSDLSNPGSAWFRAQPHAS